MKYIIKIKLNVTCIYKTYNKSFDFCNISAVSKSSFDINIKFPFQDQAPISISCFNFEIVLQY